MKHSELIDIFDWFQRVAWRSESDEKNWCGTGRLRRDDGSEIHEAVITLLAIARNGAQAVCFAPDKPQRDVINHLTGGGDARAAQCAGGSSAYRPRRHPAAGAGACGDLEALIVPGGFGAAKNLSSFAAEGRECQVDPDLRALALTMHQAGKPLGFMCIAPAMLPKNLCVSAADDHWDRS
ncbi:Sigma cross-reacting protein 27A [Klebsiella pneumoniae]|nr:Sigma cross-reacting protein 27A [Klebsiella pneumoniae]